MSERKERFTPGPWHIEDTTEDVMSDCDYEIGDQGDHLIAGITPGNILEVEKANAALIAAAPEMYEELQQASTFLRILADLLDTIIQYDSRKAYRENVLNLGDRIRKRAEKIDALLVRALGEAE